MSAINGTGTGSGKVWTVSGDSPNWRINEFVNNRLKIVEDSDYLIASNTANTITTQDGDNLPAGPATFYITFDGDHWLQGIRRILFNFLCTVFGEYDDPGRTGSVRMVIEQLSSELPFPRIAFDLAPGGDSRTTGAGRLGSNAKYKDLLFWILISTNKKYYKSGGGEVDGQKDLDIATDRLEKALKDDADVLGWCGLRKIDLSLAVAMHDAKFYSHRFILGFEALVK